MICVIRGLSAYALPLATKTSKSFGSSYGKCPIFKYPITLLVTSSKLQTLALVHCTDLCMIGERAEHQSNVAVSDLARLSIASMTGCASWNNQSDVESGVLATKGML